MHYTVYGDYGYISETVLFVSTSRNEAVRWAERYVRHGDTGGYGVIEVASFATDGEYLPHWVFQAEDENIG